QLSPDGRWALFMSSANNLVVNDDNGLFLDVFLKNLETGEIHLVSANAEGGGGNGDSLAGAMSSDARYVVFQSDASDLVAEDTNDDTDVFLWSRETGTLQLISRESGGELGDGASGYPIISGDGGLVIFESSASNLVGDD